VKTTSRSIVESQAVIPVLILNWNGEADTIECLKSIRKSVPAGFAPVVMDNGSKPESLEWLKRECGALFSKILFLRRGELAEVGDKRQTELQEHLREDALVFIENGENLGFAKGNNVGVQFAELAGSEWVMLLNNDTVVAPETFEVLSEFLARHSEFLAITPQIRYYQQNTRVQNCGGDLTYFGSRKYRLANQDVSVVPKSDYSTITFITGCALLFKPSVTGAISEDFFFGEDDYEFSLRMKKLGLPMACAHRAVVYHKVGTSIKRSSQPLGAILVQYASRLINTRNYYSKARWQATRLLAYLYLPVLLARSGIQLKRWIEAIGTVEAYLKDNRSVDRSSFQAMIGLR
jgi:hypothetical protein